MKSFSVLVVLTLIGFAGSAGFASEIPKDANTCVLELYHHKIQTEARVDYSCDGNEKILKVPFKEKHYLDPATASFAINEFLKKGYRLINCSPVTSSSSGVVNTLCYFTR